MDELREPLAVPEFRTGNGPPPLRLTHLLLYMAVCSVSLAVAMSPAGNPPLSLREAADPRYRRIIVVPDALLWAATITVFLLLVVWTCQRRRVWNQPGHWIAAWLIWQLVGYYPCHELVMLGKWLTGVETADDMIEYWKWAKGFYALQYLPFALLFLCLAAGWRRVADTWPWRLYFAGVGIWLAFGPTYHWLDWMSEALPNFGLRLMGWFVAYFHQWRVELLLLLLAMANDLRLGRNRHWSHWVPAILPLLSQAFNYLPPLVWDALHSNR